MDRLRTCIERSFDNAIAPQIAFRGGGCADPDGLVGLTHEGRFHIGIGIDRDRPQAEPSGGSHDASGNLAAVGDQDR